MKLTNSSAVPVYTVSGSSTARQLPEWLIRRRKRSLKQDSEFANRVELLQDFEFEEASTCIRVSEDGDWVVSTGTYKPQIHVHYLPHLSLSFARHTTTLNETFLLLSSDYSKSLHLQTDRVLEFHSPQGCHYSTRIPRYGRDLKYDRRSAEALVPSVGVNENGFGEVFRLNLEVGRFMRGYEVDVGGDDLVTPGGGALQGGIDAGSVNTAAIAEDSHNLLAFGTSIGTVEFWDSRSRTRAGVLPPPPSMASHGTEAPTAITALQFDRTGLNLACGSSLGLIHLYDLRSPAPLLKKDQGYGYPIQDIIYLQSGSSTSSNTHLTTDPKILSSDKRIIKIWGARDGSPWTSVEPTVDINSVAWCKDSGMVLTANEGRQQHSFFIPQLGPAPKWCGFLDNLVEEMAEDSHDPSSFTGHKPGEIYDNFKFLTIAQLRQLSLDHLVGTTSLLRPYMHGYFVNQQLYEEARLISNPDLWQEQRQKSIRDKIEKERESRIRGSKKAAVKVNRRLADRLIEREEKNERRKAKRALERGEAMKLAEETNKASISGDEEEEDTGANRERETLLNDPRFSALFQDEDFAVDEASREFQMRNPSTKAVVNGEKPLTAVEEEQLDDGRKSSEDELSDQNSDEEASYSRAQRKKPAEPASNRISTASYRKSGHVSQNVQDTSRQPRMHSYASNPQRAISDAKDKSFGGRAARLGPGQQRKSHASRGVMGDKEVTFVPQPKTKSKRLGLEPRPDSTKHENNISRKNNGRRSASGNTFRKM